MTMIPAGQKASIYQTDVCVTTRQYPWGMVRTLQTLVTGMYACLGRSFVRQGMAAVKAATSQAVVAVTGLAEDILVAQVTRGWSSCNLCHIFAPLSAYRILRTIDPDSDESFRLSLLALCSLDKKSKDRRLLIGSTDIWTKHSMSMTENFIDQRYFREVDVAPIYQLTLIYEAIIHNPHCLLNAVHEGSSRKACSGNAQHLSGAA